jgi:cytochrome P450
VGIDIQDLVVSRRYVDGQPHETWAAMRRETPVLWCEPDGFPPFWALTKHADVKAVSVDFERFSSRGPVQLARLGTESVESSLLGPTADPFGSRNLLNTDPPEHRDYRNLARDYFRPGALRRLEPRVREISRALIDNVAGHSELDFVTEVAARHPLRMLAEMLGLDNGDEQRLLRLTNAFVGAADPEYHDGPGVGAEFGAYLARLLADRRAHPRHDLTSLVANARLRGRPMSDLDAIVYLLIIAIAGHDTTRGAIGGGMLALLRHQDQLELLRARPELCASAADEIVRWISPVVHFLRTATEDCEIAGRRIRAGDRLVLYYPSANRDEEVFDEPAAFRADRAPNPHLGWGFGEHYCLGANLARMEIRVLLEELVPRLEWAELAGPPSWTASRVVCGPKHLPVRWRLKGR